MSDSGWKPLSATVYCEAAYVERIQGDVARTTSVHEAVLLDFDKDGRLLGVEVLASPKGNDDKEEEVEKVD